MVVAGTLVVVVPGAVEQVEIVVHGKEAVTGALPEIVSALTRTGITAPVVRPKSRWWRTVDPRQEFTSKEFHPQCGVENDRFTDLSKWKQFRQSGW